MSYFEQQQKAFLADDQRRHLISSYRSRIKFIIKNIKEEINFLINER